MQTADRQQMKRAGSHQLLAFFPVDLAALTKDQRSCQSRLVPRDPSPKILVYMHHRHRPTTAWQILGTKANHFDLLAAIGVQADEPPFRSRMAGEVVGARIGRFGNGAVGTKYSHVISGKQIMNSARNRQRAACSDRSPITFANR